MVLCIRFIEGREPKLKRRLAWLYPNWWTADVVRSRAPKKFCLCSLWHIFSSSVYRNVSRFAMATGTKTID